MEYSITVNKLKKSSGNLKAFASVCFGGHLRVGNIALIENGDGKVFVSMPRYKTSRRDERGQDVYQDICNPITKDFRDRLYKDIIRAYETGDSKYIERKDDIMPEIRVSVFSYEKEDSNLRALGKVVVDECFILNNVVVLESKEGKNFIAMPSFKTNQKDEKGKEIYRDIYYPVTKEFREKVYGEIMEAYGVEKDRMMDMGKQASVEKVKTFSH